MRRASAAAPPRALVLGLLLALPPALVGACDSPAPAATDVADHERPSAPGVPEGLLAPGALASVLPDRIGPFRASGDATGDVARGLAPTAQASRAYQAPALSGAPDGASRRATLRVIDAARAPELIAGFAAAQQIVLADEPSAGLASARDELLPTGIAGRPALASWSPRSATSEAQVLLANRLVVALAVIPATASDEAVGLLESLDLDAIERRAR